MDFPTFPLVEVDAGKEFMFGGLPRLKKAWTLEFAGRAPNSVDLDDGGA